MSHIDPLLPTVLMLSVIGLLMVRRRAGLARSFLLTAGAILFLAG